MTAFRVSRTLIKTDRNGTEYYEVVTRCPRCGGQGGQDAWIYTGWTCYECGGDRNYRRSYIEKVYTPEYEAKLIERRAKREAEKRSKYEEEHAEEIKARKAEEAKREEERKRLEELKARSQYIGNEGDKIDINVTLEHKAHYTARFGYRETTILVYNFRDDQGNKLIWKTSSGFNRSTENGEKLHIKATIKAHEEYKDEKQTQIIRVKEV